MKQYIKFRKWYKLIRDSGLFDAKYYLFMYPDVRLSDVDPIWHYIKYGVEEYRNPSRDFNTRYYLTAYSDVQESRINPLVHFVLFGKKENRFAKKPQEFKNINLERVINPKELNITLLKDFEVPFFKTPLVSIVIPAYNQAQYTYNTIVSIVESYPETSYEIIVIDDNSSQQDARDLGKKIKNIHFISNEKNLGFLKNCNKGSKYANGKYIVFLNNDTFVLQHWLDSLVELIESNRNIGMVGSKFIYPDGRLQEAGGIIWSDASGWNYGRLDSPHKSEYCYVKEVDYISGASIMLSKTLWREVGGFDERYTPAYYEDCDLAFTVREKGFKVMFQPSSVLVHFEGISNGTDTSNGTKRYQVINRKKFYDKWKKVLEKEHFKNAQNVFLARDRSFNKKNLLFIDHYVPHFDQDAGSRATLHYLELFVSQGMNIKFIGDNFYDYPNTPYVTSLEQMGIEVLYGTHYLNNWKDWLKQNGKYFDYIVLSRPHISEKYIDYVKKYSKAKIIYFPVDLHYLREEREYLIKKDVQLLESSKKIKEIEYEIMNKSDLTCCYSSIEVSEIVKENNNINAIQIPLYIYQKFSKIDYFFKKREHIMFVGGFGHSPNVDAVIWLIEEIMPKVRKNNLSCKVFIVGSNTPETVLNYAKKNTDIVVLGRVSDKELDNLYKTCKLAVAPLRFGAGVKGKVVEALYNGIPLVTTSVGAEGLEDVEQVVKIANTSTEFSQCIVDVYTNHTLSVQLSKESSEYCKKYFSSQYACKCIIEKGFDMLETGI